jgi:hypothetical protein
VAFFSRLNQSEKDLGKINRDMKIVIGIFLLIISFSSFSMDVEVEGSYSYEQYYYGTSNENKFYNNSWLGTVAFFPFTLTALSFDFVQGQSILLEDQEYPAGSSSEVVYRKTDVKTQTYSINLRQAFTASDSFIRPMISLGWARRISLNSGYTDFRDNNSGEVTRVTQPEQDLKQDLTQLAIYLKFRIFKGFFLSVNARTLFEGFEIAKANQNLRVFVGFSWLL